MYTQACWYIFAFNKSASHCFHSVTTTPQTHCQNCEVLKKLLLKGHTHSVENNAEILCGEIMPFVFIVIRLCISVCQDMHILKDPGSALYAQYCICGRYENEFIWWILGSADVSSLLAVADNFVVLGLYQILFKFQFYGSIKLKSELKKTAPHLSKMMPNTWHTDKYLFQINVHILFFLWALFLFFSLLIFSVL